MKYPGLYLLSVIALAGSVPAQSQPGTSASKADISKADKAVIREWLAHAQPNFPVAQDGLIAFNVDDRDSYCAFMRTYRVKREERGSDATQPTGYTTCVPINRFEMKRSAQPKTELAP